jgi:hypothetical protein
MSIAASTAASGVLYWRAVLPFIAIAAALLPVRIARLLPVADTAAGVLSCCACTPHIVVSNTRVYTILHSPLYTSLCLHAQAFEKACGKKIAVEVGPRRGGDLDTIYAGGSSLLLLALYRRVCCSIHYYDLFKCMWSVRPAGYASAVLFCCCECSV